MEKKLFIILKCRQQRINYKDLKRSFVIFVCTFDLFGERRHIYTFENRCIQSPESGFEDDTTKIVLNTKGTMDDVTSEMKKLLDFIDGKTPEDDFTRELNEAVQSVRKNEKWKLDYSGIFGISIRNDDYHN